MRLLERGVMAGLRLLERGVMAGLGIMCLFKEPIYLAARTVCWP